jgi:hypothetical protein
MKFIFKLSTVALVLLLPAQFTGAEDWTRFHQDLGHTGETSDVIENPGDFKVN